MISYRSNLLVRGPRGGASSHGHPDPKRMPQRNAGQWGTPWSAADVDRVLDLLAAGESKAAAARAVGRPPSSIRSLLESIELGHRAGRELRR